MKTTIKFLKSGKVSVEVRDHRVVMNPAYGQYYFCTLMSAEPFGDVGDEGCVGTIKDVSPNALRSGESRTSVFLCDNPEGISGNSDRNIRKLNGWRGTTNDSSITAHGWRRIEESAPLKRGYGWRTVFSEELK